MFKDKSVMLTVEPIIDYSNEEFSSDLINFIIEKNDAPVNHLICLGQGNLSERTVIDLYIDENGKISQNPHYVGLNEISEVYDYSNVESNDELLKSGTDKLLEYQNFDNIEITIENSEKDVGDIVGGEEVVTGLKISGEITKKIVKIQNNEAPKFVYEVGNRTVM